MSHDFLVISELFRITLFYVLSVAVTEMPVVNLFMKVSTWSRRGSPTVSVYSIGHFKKT